MALPNFQKLILPLLNFTADGQPHTLEEAAQAVVIKLNLNEAEANEWLPGVQRTRIVDYLSRAATQLRKAQLLERAGRGKFRITERGRKELENPPLVMDVHYLQKYPEFSRVTTNRGGIRVPPSLARYIDLDDPVEVTAMPSFVLDHLTIDRDVETEEVMDWPEDENDESAEGYSQAEQSAKNIRYQQDAGVMEQSMSDQEYKDYLNYLFDQNVTIPRTLIKGRSARFSKSTDQAEEALEGLRRAMGIVNYIWEQLDEDGDIYRIFREEVLRETVGNARKGVIVGHDLANETGLLQVVTEHFDEIIEGMRVEHFPKEELAILRDLGVKNPQVALHATVYLLKRRRRLLHESGYYDLARELVTVFEMLPGRFERSLSPQPYRVEGQKRRNWKVLGGVIEGAGMVIGNVLMVINPLGVTISAPEAQSYGAITSVTGGIGKIVASFGELGEQ